MEVPVRIAKNPPPAISLSFFLSFFLSIFLSSFLSFSLFLSSFLSSFDLTIDRGLKKPALCCCHCFHQFTSFPVSTVDSVQTMRRTPDLLASVTGKRQLFVFNRNIKGAGAGTGLGVANNGSCRSSAIFCRSSGRGSQHAHCHAQDSLLQ